MKKLLFVLALLATGCVHVWTPSTEVRSVSFGRPDEADNLVPTNRIPYQVGSPYAWKLTVHSSKSKFRVKEIFKLPSSAPWSGATADSERVKIIKEQRSQSGDMSTKEFDVETDFMEETEVIQPYWIIDGDPQGTYSISIFVENKFVTNFNFQVVREQR